MQKLKFIQNSLILLALTETVYLGWQVGQAVRIEFTPHRQVIITEEKLELLLQRGDPFFGPTDLTREEIELFEQYRDPQHLDEFFAGQAQSKQLFEQSAGR